MNFRKILLLILTVFVLNTATASAFSGSGTGTSSDPYLITNCSELQEIESGSGDYVVYKITQDIDCSDTVNWNGGLGFEPLGTEVSPLEWVDLQSDGGVKISNLHINRPEQDYVGLFGYVGLNSGISLVGLEDPAIIGHDYVGGFIGYSVSDSYTAWLSTTYVNGGTITGNDNVGGLVGYATELLVETSYSTAEIVGNSNTGGIIGVSDNSDLSDTYYDIQTSGQSDTSKGTGTTTAAMKMRTTFAGWDFNTVWGITEKRTYPYFGNPGIISAGTEENPYQISSCLALQSMSNDLDAYYELTQDINCSDTVNWNSGLGFVPIGLGTSTAFSGVLDGAGYTISDLFINTTSDDDGSAGLFATSEGGTVSDLTLEDVDISGLGGVGGLIGSASQDYASSTRKTIVSNVHVSGILYAESNLLGGLIGHAIGGTRISNSSTNVILTSGSLAAQIGGLVGWDDEGYIIESYSIGSVTGAYNVGGLIGRVDDTEILNSYSTANVTSTSGNAGGLVGLATSANIQNSYSAGEVTGSQAGGLVGENTGSTITTSYYDIQTSGQSDTGKGTGTTTAAMKLSTTFTNWDFDTVWGIEEAVTYPTLSQTGITGEIPVEELQTKANRSGYRKQTGGKLPIQNGSAELRQGAGGSGVSIEQAKEALLAITQSFTRNLTLGLQGDDVKLLQYFLISQNSGPHAVLLAQVGATGYFGTLTQEAVIEFQKVKNIVPAVGFVGSLTRAQISNILNLQFVEVYSRFGSIGSEVQRIQEFLISSNIGPAAHELAGVGVTGYFGQLTQQAVIEFQKANGITGEDGYVGQKTKELIK